MAQVNGRHEKKEREKKEKCNNKKTEMALQVKKKSVKKEKE